MKATGIHEYSRDCRIEGGLRIRVILICILYFVFTAFSVLVSVFLQSFPALIILSVFILCVVLVTRPFLSEKRDYEIVDGSFRIYRVYGRAVSRKAFECELRDMIEIAPYDSRRGIEGDYDSLKNYIADSRSNDVYYAIYENNSTRIALLFDGDDKFRAAATFYARRAFRSY